MSRPKANTGEKPALEHPEIRLKINIRADMMGAGKIRLLALLGETGSISAAARELGVSYRRAWFLLDTLQACFSAPLFETSRGGAGKGGSTLTETGQELVKRHREFRATLDELAKPYLDWLETQQSGNQPS
jgi:N-terminal domain of molybdenum-binding protein